MKGTSFFYIGLTTILLVLITFLSAMSFSFSWVFYLSIIGQTLVAIMVYKVLVEKYSTNKTFEDFYQDAPIRVENTPKKNFRK